MIFFTTAEEYMNFVRKYGGAKFASDTSVLDKDGNIISKGVGKNKSEAEQLASLYALQYYGVINKDKEK